MKTKLYLDTLEISRYILTPTTFQIECSSGNFQSPPVWTTRILGNLYLTITKFELFLMEITFLSLIGEKEQIHAGVIYKGVIIML